MDQKQHLDVTLDYPWTRPPFSMRLTPASQWLFVHEGVNTLLPLSALTFLLVVSFLVAITFARLFAYIAFSATLQRGSDLRLFRSANTRTGLVNPLFASLRLVGTAGYTVGVLLTS